MLFKADLDLSKRFHKEIQVFNRYLRMLLHKFHHGNDTLIVMFTTLSVCQYRCDMILDDLKSFGSGLSESDIVLPQLGAFLVL
jgi:hypothetical protein